MPIFFYLIFNFFIIFYVNALIIDQLKKKKEKKRVHSPKAMLGRHGKVQGASALCRTLDVLAPIYSV